MEKIRILIADDHAVLRTGLRMLIEAQPDMEVVGEAAHGEQALAASIELSPDVALVDLAMPGVGGIAAVERIRRAAPETRVLVLTMHDAPAYLRAAFAAGASGYVVKRAAETELLSAIRDVFRGRTVVDASLAEEAQVGAGRRPAASRAGAGGLLSQREREVLELVAQGFTNQQMADRLGLSIKTVETYRSRLVEKLGLKSRADLVRYALDSGLLGRPDAFPEPPLL